MKSEVPDSVRVLVYHASHCDPKKCTGTRLAKMKEALLVKEMKRIPRGAVVLNPVSRTALSPVDAGRISKGGIVALDCSWKRAEDIFRRSRYGSQRALPYLLAANPINTYKPIKLSTAEAISAALYITGFQKRAREIMSVFKWGPTFLELNKAWLDSYADCKSSKEVVMVQKEIMDEHK